MVIWFNLIAIIAGQAFWIGSYETLEECQVEQHKFEEAHPEARVWCPFVVMEKA